MMTASLMMILPELVLCLTAIAALMIGAFMKQKAFTSVLILSAASLVVAAYLFTQQPMQTLFVFNDLVRIDAFILFVKILIVLSALLALILSTDWLERLAAKPFEYPVLVLLSVTGLCLLVSANDFLSLYLALELSSLSLYVMAAIDRDNPKASEAGLKYFILGALASGMLLFGISLVYGMTGTTNFTALAGLLSDDNASITAGLAIGLVMVMVGLFFKVSAVPFHMWTPDVYEGAPTPVVTFFAVAPKIGALAIFVRLLLQPFEGLTMYWQDIMIMVSVASMLLGAFGALRQHNIKRLLAYSSIGHVGYMLIGLVVGGTAGVQAMLIYLSLYIFMSVGAFGFIIVLKRNGMVVEQLDDLSGLSKHHPKLALFMALIMFSMAGIPPLAGFFGKMYIFLAAIEANLYTLVIIGLLSSVVASYYYIKLVKIMYFDEPKEALDIKGRSSAVSVLILCGAVTVLFFLSPTGLLELTGHAAAIFSR